MYRAVFSIRWLVHGWLRCPSRFVFANASVIYSATDWGSSCFAVTDDSDTIEDHDGRLKDHDGRLEDHDGRLEDHDGRLGCRVRCDLVFTTAITQCR
jgi:hypothetical protein